MGAILSLLKGGAEAKPIDLPIDFNGMMIISALGSYKYVHISLSNSCCHIG
jgi:hypothetical protein